MMFMMPIPEISSAMAEQNQHDGEDGAMVSAV